MKLNKQLAYLVQSDNTGECVVVFNKIAYNAWLDGAERIDCITSDTVCNQDECKDMLDNTPDTY